METQIIGQFQGAALRLVRIEWEGPFSLPDALQKSAAEDYGLFMIDGHNLLYGCKGAL